MLPIKSKQTGLKLITSLIGLGCLTLSLNVKAAFIDIDFTIDGNTWDNPFTVQNNSSSGFDIIQLALDLRPNASNGLCFDEVVNSCQNTVGKNFAVVGSGDVGFSSYSIVDAVGGISSTDFLLVTFTENSFSAGEQFSWEIDIDGTGSNGTILGNDLIGSLFYVEMSDGLTYEGVIQGIDGNNDAGQFVLSGQSSGTIEDAISSVPEPSSIMLFGGLLFALTSLRRKITR